jgi:hypothetical protein
MQLRFNLLKTQTTRMARVGNASAAVELIELLSYYLNRRVGLFSPSLLL